MLRRCVQERLDIAPALAGKRVTIRESLSRSRDVGGHDRHFATSSHLQFTVQRINTLLSGTHRQFDDGVEQWYGVALEVVVAVHYVDGQRLEIREQFETKTERLTVISIIT